LYNDPLLCGVPHRWENVGKFLQQVVVGAKKTNHNQPQQYATSLLTITVQLSVINCYRCQPNENNDHQHEVNEITSLFTHNSKHKSNSIFLAFFWEKILTNFF
jgi:hypothetical protein